MTFRVVKAVLAIMIGLFLLSLPYFATNPYTLHVYALIGIYTIIAIGLNIFFGYTGQLSLGHAAYYGIGAYAVAILTTRLGFPFPIAFVCAGLVSLAFGIGVGIPTLKLEGPYLAMATIGFGEIVRMALINWETLSGGPAGISKIPDPSLFGFGLHTVQAKYYLILAVTFIGYVCYRNLMNSDYGKQFIAVREHPMAAEAMGVNTTRIKVLAFGLSTLYAGIAGSLYAHLNRYVAPDAFTFSESVTLLLIVVLGGRGSILGPILGALVLIEFRESLRMLKDYNMLIYGLSIIVLMIFLRKGLTGINLPTLLQWVKSKTVKSSKF